MVNIYYGVAVYRVYDPRIKNGHKNYLCVEGKRQKCNN